MADGDRHLTPAFEVVELDREVQELRLRCEQLEAENLSLTIQNMTMATAMFFKPEDLERLKRLAINISELFKGDPDESD